MVRRLVASCAASAALACPLAVSAAELTEVVDAFDEANNNPFDFHLEPVYRHESERARISRESGCTVALTPDRCTFDSLVFNRELDYRRTTNAIDIDMQLSLFRDLELHLSLPIVANQRTSLELADGVTPDVSSVAPSDERIATDLASGGGDAFGALFGTYYLFDLPAEGRTRSGVGDMRVGLAWSPWNDARQPHAATLTFAFDYTAPSGTPARASNSGVGRGVHEIELGILASRRIARYFDPYFGLRASYAIPSGSGLFERNDNSRHYGPGAEVNITTGSEFIIAEQVARQQRYTFDLGFDFGYQLEGRDYGPLFEGLANSSCNGTTPADVGYTSGGPDGNGYTPPDGIDGSQAACAWVVQQPGLAQTRAGVTAANTPYVHDGITDIEGHANIGGHTAFNLQFTRYFELRLRFGLRYTSPHLLTMADAGRDTDNDAEVDLDPNRTDGAVERNPNYNLALDSVGRRFRSEAQLALSFSSAFAFQF